MAQFVYPASSVSIPGVAAEATLSTVSSTLTALTNKSAGALVPEAFDEIVLAYVGATTKVATATYKLATVTVATLTFTYDGSDRLTNTVAS